MTAACRDVRSNLARPPGELLAAEATVHLASCGACREHVAASDRLVEALRVEPEPVDDITRSRWLARLSPQLDEIAAARTRPQPSRRPVWLAVAAAAVVVALAIGWWSRRPDGALAVVPEVVLVDQTPAWDRALLRPYVTTGPSDDSTATNLLANKLSTLAVGAGQLVRASFDHDRDQRLGIVGPARVEVTAASSAEVELALTGTLLVDARSDTVVRVVAGGLVIRAQRATFAVQHAAAGPVVFVDRGELVVGTDTIRAGDWYGTAGSAALVQLLRDHASALAPPTRGTGILAVAGSHPVLTRRGAVLGTAPLWARVDPGELELVIAGAREHRASVVVGDRLVRFAEPTESSPVAPLRVAPAPPPTRDAAAELYARAERALGTGDATTAARLWGELVDAHPSSKHAAHALYDLANLARGRDRGEAQTYLRRLLAGSPPAALREPARYLTCRLHVEVGELEPAARCFTAFRAAFPSSSHDAEILAWLAGDAEARGDCTLAAEYARVYPSGPFAARARACQVTP